MTNFKMVPEGTHESRIVLLAFVGTIPKTFKDKTKNVYTLVIGYELCDESYDTQDGKVNLMAYKDYNFSYAKKSLLRKHIEALLERPLKDEECDYTRKDDVYNIKELLGSIAQITTVHRHWENEAKGTNGDVVDITNIGAVLEKYRDGVAASQREQRFFDIRQYADLDSLLSCTEYKILPKYVKSFVAKTNQFNKLVEAAKLKEEKENPTPVEKIGDKEELPF